MRRTAPWMLATLCLALGAAAQAADGNFRPYLVGSRAAGMGGAFTALSDDGSGSYYNPGGLAFAPHSSLSLSGSVYGLVSGTTSNALGDGRDFTYRDLNIFPVSTSAVRKLGAPDAETGVAPHTLVFSVFVPNAYQADDRDHLGLPQNSYFYAQNTQTLWAGGGYAYRAGRVGLGVMAYGVLGTDTRSLDLTAIAANDASRFVILSARLDDTTYGGLLAAGARWDVTDRWRLGLSVFSPELGTGSRRVFVRQAVGANVTTSGTPQAVDVSLDGLSASPQVPLRIQAGVAYTQGRWTFAGDVIFLGGREYASNEQGGQHFKFNPVVDASVGAEYVYREKFPLRAGLFTDFSSSPSPIDVTVDNSTHINRYGVSLSGGYKTEHVATDLGLNLAYGQGQTAIPQNLDFNHQVSTDASELTAYVFLATSYDF